ncbi:hypothetical protein [Candidatus Trichorickettsia mobilis]|uniref:hypothetical protein n=1 Tax=Candidatus Trichorickettsia mobilis TaxID=1346319 RepID=UPI002930FC5D|nr:hypothetical protein [Candidatus Trichorickettsia mobilis]
MKHVHIPERFRELNGKIEETTERLLQTAVEGAILTIPPTDLEVLTAIADAGEQLTNIITKLKGKYDLQDLACSLLRGFPGSIYFSMYYKDLILDIFYGQGIIIDLNAKSQNGDSVLDIITTSNGIHAINLGGIVKAMSKHQVDWTQKFGDEQNNLPLSFLKSENYCFGDRWGIAKTLLRQTDEQQIPLFDVNYKNDNGERLIDLADGEIEIIKALRNLGSVEPKKPISSIIKLDLSNGRLDGYELNQISASEILTILQEKFSLTEEQITQEINDFKSNDFSGWTNSKWHSVHNQLTIPAVVDLLSGMNNVHDRLPQNWDFKAVLASIIYIVRTSNDEMLYNSLIHCLSELHMCDLGKLMNLLYVVQDQVSIQQVNYENTDFVDSLPIFEETISKISHLSVAA